MLYLVVLLMLVIGSFSYYGSLQAYKNSTKELKRNKSYYEAIKSGMSLAEVISLMGNNKTQINNKGGVSTYRWMLNETIVGKEYMKNKNSAKTISLSDYFKNYSKSYLTKGQAFVEVSLENGKVCNKRAVGLA